MSKERQSAVTRIQIFQIAALLLAASAGAPAFAAKPVDRAALTKGLVPVTGEKTRSIDLTVPFARDSAKLRETARRQLDELAAALSGEKLKKFRVEVYGHTDASGPAEYNMKLSKARAAETVRYLVQQHGLDRKRFRHEGYGEERLLTGLDPRSPRHRRVEVVVVNQRFGFPEDASKQSMDADDVKKGDERDGEKKGESGGLRAVR